MNQNIKKNKLLNAFMNVKDEIITNSSIEVISNRSAVIQGTKGILEYNDDLIRISLDEFEVQFYGTKLSIQCLSQDSLEIKGTINRIEYV